MSKSKIRYRESVSLSLTPHGKKMLLYISIISSIQLLISLILLILTSKSKQYGIDVGAFYDVSNSVGGIVIGFAVVGIVFLLLPVRGYKQILRFYYLIVCLIYLLCLISGLFFLLFRNFIFGLIGANIVVSDSSIDTFDKIFNNIDLFKTLYYTIIAFLMVLFVFYFVLSILLSKIIDERVANEISLSIYNTFVFLISIFCIYNMVYSLSIFQSQKTYITALFYLVIFILTYFIPHFISQAIVSRKDGFYQYPSFMSSLLILIFILLAALFYFFTDMLTQYIDVYELIQMILPSSTSAKYNYELLVDQINSNIGNISLLLLFIAVILYHYKHLQERSEDLNSSLLREMVFKYIDRDDTGSISPELLKMIFASERENFNQIEEKDILLLNRNHDDESEGLNFDLFDKVLEYRRNVEALISSKGGASHLFNSDLSERSRLLRVYHALFTVYDKSEIEIMNQNARKNRKCQISTIFFWTLFTIVVLCCVGFLVVLIMVAIYSDEMKEDPLSISTSLNPNSPLFIKKDTAGGKIYIDPKSSDNLLYAEKSMGSDIETTIDKNIISCKTGVGWMISLMSNQKCDIVLKQFDQINIDDKSHFGNITIKNHKRLSASIYSEHIPTAIYHSTVKSLDMKTLTGGIIQNTNFECDDNEKIYAEFQYGNFNLENITVSKCGQFRVNGDSGTFKAENITSYTDNQLHLQRGYLFVNNVTFDKLDLSLYKGDLNIKNVKGNILSITSSVGSIVLDELYVSQGIFLRTYQGSITIHIDMLLFKGQYHVHTKGVFDVSSFWDKDDYIEDFSLDNKGEDSYYSGKIGCKDDCHNYCVIMIKSDQANILFQRNLHQD